MRIRRFAAAAMLGIAGLGLSACAQSLRTQVTRYQAMPGPQGQTFIVVPGEGMAAPGGLEFQRYAGLVAQQLQARGYQPAAGGQGASMIVQLGYSVDHGQTRIVDYPYGYSGFGPGRFGFARFGFHRSPFFWGWDDPFWYGPNIDSYVEYHGEADLHIRAAGTNQALFDGRAQARSQTNRLDVLVPDLLEALFTGFPGQNGEVVKITVPARKGGVASY
jgi:hypothetical protein